MTVTLRTTVDGREISERAARTHRGDVAALIADLNDARRNSLDIAVENADDEFDAATVYPHETGGWQVTLNVTAHERLGVPYRDTSTVSYPDLLTALAAAERLMRGEG